MVPQQPSLKHPHRDATQRRTQDQNQDKPVDQREQLHSSRKSRIQCGTKCESECARAQLACYCVYLGVCVFWHLKFNCIYLWNFTLHHNLNHNRQPMYSQRSCVVAQCRLLVAVWQPPFSCTVTHSTTRVRVRTTVWGACFGYLLEPPPPPIPRTSSSQSVRVLFAKKPH